MIPHTAKPPLRTRKARLLPPSPRRAGSAELSCHESADGTTGFFSFSKSFGFREDADHGLGSARPNEHAATPVKRLVEPFHLVFERFWKRFWKLSRADAHVLLHLWKTLHLRGRLSERPA